jgi:hypothetical protein
MLDPFRRPRADNLFEFMAFWDVTPCNLVDRYHRWKEHVAVISYPEIEEEFSAILYCTSTRPEGITINKALVKASAVSNCPCYCRHRPLSHTVMLYQYNGTIFEIK